NKSVRVFNKKCPRKVWEQCEKPRFLFFELKGDYKESFKESFNNATKQDIKLLLKLPNFDYKVFEEISGITKKMIDNKLR
ncbi:MAG: hypothetical protein ACOCUR_02170, partial [Nanoarchaeota archaeon]